MALNFNQDGTLIDTAPNGDFTGGEGVDFDLTSDPTRSAVVVKGKLRPTVTDGITAHSGGGQGSAVPLTTDVNRISSVGAPGDSVLLPVALPKRAVYVFNADGSNAAAVFPSSGDQIDGAGANNSVTLSSTLRAVFFCLTAGSWISAQLGAPSA